MNSVDYILDFFKDINKTKLLVNQVNEEIGFFYVRLVENEAHANDIRLNYRDNIVRGEIKDLFGKSEINLCFQNNNKKIEDHINSDSKCIIFTDYKNYKKYSSTSFAINGYNYQKDIEYYIKNILLIKNTDVIDFCINNPYLTFSEVSKYLLNNHSYIKENQIKKDKNFILDIRKELFNLKRNQRPSIDIYSNLKQEVKYKKFNFLIY